MALQRVCRGRIFDLGEEAPALRLEKISRLDLSRSLRGRLLPQGAMGGARTDKATLTGPGRQALVDRGRTGWHPGRWDRGREQRARLPFIGHQAVAYEDWPASSVKQRSLNRPTTGRDRSGRGAHIQQQADQIWPKDGSTWAYWSASRSLPIPNVG
jgi:hypothetical protein